MSAEPDSWLIDLIGSEIAVVEPDGADLVVVLAAAQVRGDRKQLDPARCGGHLLGVRWRLVAARWSGQVSALIGRIDEVEWHRAGPDSNALARPLKAPGQSDSPLHLSLRTALGEHLTVQARAWRLELEDGARLAPAMAC